MPSDFTLAEVAGMLRKLGKKIHQRHWPHECACDEMAGHLPDCLNAAARTMAAALEAMEPFTEYCEANDAFHGGPGKSPMCIGAPSTCKEGKVTPLYAFRAEGGK